MRTLMLCAALAAGPLHAQAPVRLDRADAEFPEPYSNIVGLIELSDGRVLLADALEQTLSRIDFRNGDVALIGRQGNGPGEFGLPGQLFALGGDTVMMLDLANARGMLITPDGRIASTSVSFASGDEGFRLFPRTVDGRGRFYGTTPIRFDNGVRATPDSLPVVRWAPGGATDTVLKLPAESQGMTVMRIERGAGGGANIATPRRRAFAATDLWAVAPDGRIALVHADPYHLEWIATNGRRTRGPTVAYQPVRVTQRDREEWADRQTQGQMVMRTEQGTRTMRPPRPSLDAVDFPEVKPPFESIRVAPSGEVWVAVSQPAGAERTRYDVFDAQGRRVRQVELGTGRRLLGFGRGTVYLARIDEDDLQWVERYRL